MAYCIRVNQKYMYRLNYTTNGASGVQGVFLKTELFPQKIKDFR